jgi:hypothetical protein
MMKDLGLLHKDFPHHLMPAKADKEDQLSGLVQALAAEVYTSKTKPKKVRFGPPQSQSDSKLSQVINSNRLLTPMSKKTSWLQEQDHISESNMSDDEEEPHSNKSNLVEQVYRPITQGYQAQAKGSAGMRPKPFKKTHRAPPMVGCTPHCHPNPRKSSKAHFSGRLHRARVADSSQDRPRRGQEERKKKIVPMGALKKEEDRKVTNIHSIQWSARWL